MSRRFGVGEEVKENSRTYWGYWCLLHCFHYRQKNPRRHQGCGSEREKNEKRKIRAVFAIILHDHAHLKDHCCLIEDPRLPMLELAAPLTEFA